MPSNGVVDNKIHCHNVHLLENANDHLYHFGIDRVTTDIPKEFGDVKFVCTGGSPSRFELYAKLFSADSGLPLSENLSKTDRFCMYKTGPVLWVNHGMGAPSLSIMLVETIKLLHYAGATDVAFIRIGTTTDVAFIRIGTSGGVGVAPGTVVVSSGALNGELLEAHVQYIMGKRVERPAKLDQHLKDELLETGKELKMPVETGVTLCADDFYEGQSRLDGAFCEYKSEEKFVFLHKLYNEYNVRNFEMESSCFAAMTGRANAKAAIVCVALLNRFNGDQVNVDKEKYHEFEMRPYRLVASFIKGKI
uniref:PNP_UDP_1 domain-containing protein n=1 Tax=Steinernema glaseri TaxID=37863 RepID=A0A1I7YMB5_9BILA